MGLTRGLGAVCTVLVACGQPGSAENTVERTPDIETTTAALTSPNGTTFNGITYGGWSLSYSYSRTLTSYTLIEPLYATNRTLTGSLDSTSGLSPNGTSTYDGDAVRLDGSEIVDVDGNGTIDARDLSGSTLTGVLDSGEEIVLKINSVEVGADGRFRFGLTAGPSKDEATVSLCGVDAAGQPRKAIAVPGVWNTEAGVDGGGAWSNDEGLFSFACDGSSIEKCVRLGYGPEELDHFNRPHRLLACVRMLRADYCGDGSTWTTDGRLVEVWDSAGINTRSEPDWPREAAWTPEGAMCLDNPRLLFPDSSASPFCLARLKYLPCSKYTPASIWSSFAHDGVDADDADADAEPKVEEAESDAKPSYDWRQRWHRSSRRGDDDDDD